MAKDYAALKGFLESEAGFDTNVRAKSIRPLIEQLNGEESGQTSSKVVSSEDVLDAIGSGIRTLTSAQKETLRLFTNRENVDFRKVSIRAEIIEVFSGQAQVLARIQSLVTRTKTFCERFGFDRVTKEDLWKVLPQIPKSYMAIYRARG